MKYIDADLLRKESERLRKLLEDHNYYLDNSEQSVGYANALLDIENFLDTLSEEPDKSLEEAAEEYRKESFKKSVMPQIDGPVNEYGGNIKNAFKAGAEWDRKQQALTWEDIRTICTLSVKVEIDLGREISDERHYGEVLRRFNETREKK